MTRKTVSSGVAYLTLNCWIDEVQVPDLVWNTPWKQWGAVIPGGAYTQQQVGELVIQTPHLTLANYPAVTQNALEVLSIPTVGSPIPIPTDGIDPGEFILYAISAPVQTGRTWLRGGTITFREYAVNVTVGYPKWYVGVVGGTAILYPGELFNVAVVFGTTSGLIVRDRALVGGVFPQPTAQEWITVPGTSMRYRPSPYTSADSVSGVVSGNYTRIAGTPPPDFGRPLYGVGWGSGIRYQENLESTASSSGIPNPFYPLAYEYEYREFTSDVSFEGFLDPRGSHHGIRRAYFFDNGQVSVCGNPILSSRFTDTVGGSGSSTKGKADLVAALPDQCSNLAFDGPFLETSHSLPLLLNPPAKNIDGQTGDTVIRVARMFDLTQIEDVNAATAPGDYPSYGVMSGSGFRIVNYPGAQNLALWWHSDREYKKIANTAGSIHGICPKPDDKWFGKPVSPALYRSPLPGTALKANAAVTGTTLLYSYYEWTKVHGVGTGDELKTVRLRLMRSQQTAVSVSGSVPGGPFADGEAFTVATLDDLPYCPASIIVEPHTGLVRLMDGMSGSWKSADAGETWATDPDWVAAFESPRLPLGCQPLGPYWLALALDHTNFPPTILSRRSFDYGAHWEDEVEVGQLDEFAPVWGCAVAEQPNTHRLVIVNSGRIRWYSEDCGDSWNLVEES